MKSLDLACAKAGHSIAEAISGQDEAENIVRKSLGTLQEMGVYAHFLFLAAEKKAPAFKIIKKEIELLKNTELYNLSTIHVADTHNDLGAFLASIETTFTDIHQLFAAKEMLERALTYTLYELKAKGNS